MSSSVEEYCLSSSWRLRVRTADARWLIRAAVEELPPKPPADFARHEQEWRARLSACLDDAVRQRYGNPLVIWFLLNVVVPIVVRLVIEWWLKRDEACRG